MDYPQHEWGNNKSEMIISIDLGKDHSTSLNSLSYFPIDDAVFSLSKVSYLKIKNYPS